MRNTVFLQKLAIERCQYNLAQLGAVVMTDNGHSADMTGTICLLLENVNRDLAVLDESLSGDCE